MTDPRSMPEYDEVLQMQLEEFNRKMAGATNAKTSVVIVDSGKALQSAIFAAGEDEMQSRNEAIQSIIAIAGAFLMKATDNEFQLLLRGPDGILIDAVDLSIDEASWEKRH